MHENEPIRLLKKLFKRDDTLDRHEQGEILEILKDNGLLVAGIIQIPDEWWAEVLKGEDERDSDCGA